MTDLRKAAEMALNYFESAYELDSHETEIRDALRQTLAQPEWVGLADGELPEGATYEFDRGVRWAEAKLKEKNSG